MLYYYIILSTKKLIPYTYFFFVLILRIHPLFFFIPYFFCSGILHTKLEDIEIDIKYAAHVLGGMAASRGAPRSTVYIFVCKFRVAGGGINIFLLSLLVNVLCVYTF